VVRWITDESVAIKEPFPPHRDCVSVSFVYQKYRFLSYGHLGAIFALRLNRIRYLDLALGGSPRAGRKYSSVEQARLFRSGLLPRLVVTEPVRSLYRARRVVGGSCTVVAERPRMSNNIIQERLAFRRRWSGTVLHPRLQRAP
jgi:hypothetical protein